MHESGNSKKGMKPVFKEKEGIKSKISGI